ncbi:MAG: fluoride efflux transporter CrcB [Gammaproteobacteria bacterium]|nr:fluoride efflux transporter CrcB [Gammaproteobacteria bacterium]
MKLAAVAAGGAIGASLRYIAAAMTHTIMGKDFPYGTLMVNVMGSLIIGYLLVLLPDSEKSIPLLRLLIITGVLGGFTTYSAFSIETLQLIQNGHLTKAGLNVVLTLLLCFLAVWAGFVFGRHVHP